MKQLEKEIQANVVELLNAVGASVYRIGTKRRKGDYQGTMQTPGIPDLVAFVHCFELWIEVKRPGGKMSEAQKEFRRCALEKGAGHVVGGVDEVVDWLKARGVVK